MFRFVAVAGARAGAGTAKIGRPGTGAAKRGSAPQPWTIMRESFSCVSLAYCTPVVVEPGLDI